MQVRDHFRHRGGSTTTHDLTAQSSGADGISELSAAVAVTVDLTAPAVPTITGIFPDTGTSAVDGVTNAGTLTLLGTAEAGSTVSIFGYSQLLGTVTAGSTGEWSFTSTTEGLGIQGVTLTGTILYDFTAQATDAAGNSSVRSAPRSVAVDRRAPATPTRISISPDTGWSIGDGIVRTGALTVKGLAEIDSTVTLLDGAAVIATAMASSTAYYPPTPLGTLIIIDISVPRSAEFSIQLATPLSEGTHTLTVCSTDLAGNVSDASAPYAVTVDLTAPAAPAIARVVTSGEAHVTPGGVSRSGRLTVSGTAEAGSTVTLLDGTAVIGAATADAGNGSFSIALASALGIGTHSLAARATDLAGNESTLSAAYAVSVQPATVRGDVSGDGRADVIWQNANGTPSVWSMQGDAVTGASVASYLNYDNPGASWRLVGTGDLNGDGRADLVWQNTDGLPSGWLMGASGTDVQSYPVFSNPGSDWRLIGTGDLNGDGRDDLLWQRSDGLPTGWIMGPEGTTVVGYSVFSNPGADWRLVGTGDLNGDGRDDLLWQRSDGLPSAWLMNESRTGVLDCPVFSNPGHDWRLVRAADLNDDGRDDLLWQRSDGLPSGWLMNETGTGVAGYPVFGNPGADWRLTGAADANGDGRADLLWQNVNGGLPSLWIMGAGGTQIESYPVLASPGADWTIV